MIRYVGTRIAVAGRRAATVILSLVLLLVLFVLAVAAILAEQRR